jgi:segregation and condensation protein A
MPYSVKIEHFEGPLDLLLQLVESEKLEITEVSLMAATEPFIAHVRAQQGKIPPEELADFLTVAAKLVYLKSKALLPSIYDEELEEGLDLETQLRLYKSFVDASKDIENLFLGHTFMFARKRKMKFEERIEFRPPEGVNASLLAGIFEGVIKRLMPFVDLPKAALARAVTIEEKIEQLRNKISSRMRVSFHQFLAKTESKQEAVVSFLALLELIKQRIVRIEQKELFEDITIHNAS